MCDVALEKPCFYFSVIGGIVVLAESTAGQHVLL